MSVFQDAVANTNHILSNLQLDAWELLIPKTESKWRRYLVLPYRGENGAFRAVGKTLRLTNKQVFSGEFREILSCKFKKVFRRRNKRRWI